MTTFAIDPSSLTNFKDKVVLITGGSSGIGLATVQLIASLSLSNKIIILDRSPPPISLDVHPFRLHFHKCNITNWTEQREGFDAGVLRFGGIDAVFVNAGISEFEEQFFTDTLDGDGKLAEPDRRTLDADISAACDTVKLAIYHLRRNTEGGSIVMTASLAGYLATAGAAMYSAAKHGAAITASGCLKFNTDSRLLGIVGLMRALKQETAKLNIGISVVAPAITTTPMLTQNRKEALSPEDYSRQMKDLGVAINKAESVALGVAHMMNLGLKSNGMGLFIQADRMIDLEAGLAKSRETWMGKEMLDLFRVGRSAPLFDRIQGGSDVKSKI